LAINIGVHPEFQVLGPIKVKCCEMLPLQVAHCRCEYTLVYTRVISHRGEWNSFGNAMRCYHPECLFGAGSKGKGGQLASPTSVQEFKGGCVKSSLSSFCASDSRLRLQCATRRLDKLTAPDKAKLEKLVRSSSLASHAMPHAHWHHQCAMSHDPAHHAT
jgi:hypothetical protein